MRRFDQDLRNKNSIMYNELINQNLIFQFLDGFRKKGKRIKLFLSIERLSNGSKMSELVSQCLVVGGSWNLN